MAIDYPDWTGQIGALHTTNNIVTLSGAAVTGYRTFEAAVTATKLTDTNQVYVLIEESDTKKALWLATFDDEATDTLTMNTLIDSMGTFTAGEATAVEAIVVGPGAMLKAIDVAQIDLDGATDIGEALVSGDKVAIYNASGTANRVSSPDRFRTYANTAGTLLDMGETVKAHGTVTTAATIDADEGHVHTLTTTSGTGITLTLDNGSSHTGTSLTLLLIKSGTETITWAGDFNGSTRWIGGAPNLSAADTYVIFFHWLGSATICYAVYGGTL